MRWNAPLEDAEQDVFFANVIRFLIDGEDFDAAKALMTCSVIISKRFSEDYEDSYRGHHVLIKAPRAAYDSLNALMHYSLEDLSADDFIAGDVATAFNAVLDSPEIFVKAGAISSVTADWKEQMQIELEAGGQITNQGLRAEKSPYFAEWQGLRFASQSEIRVAQALDKAGVLYFPTCVARLGKPTERKNIETDFLVFHDGKYGILEVDGAAFHKTAAKDHDRDRLLQAFGGIMNIQRFTSDECFEDAESVVKKFLFLLKKA